MITTEKVDFDAIPPDLITCDRWCVWKITPGDDGKPTKPPFRADVRGIEKAKKNDLSHWVSFDVAAGRLRREHWDGIGFLFSSDGLVGIDVDACRNPESGELTPWGAEIIGAINSYSEISPSRCG